MGRVRICLAFCSMVAAFVAGAGTSASLLWFRFAPGLRAEQGLLSALLEGSLQTSNARLHEHLLRKNVRMRAEVADCRTSYEQMAQRLEDNRTAGGVLETRGAGAMAREGPQKRAFVTAAGSSALEGLAGVAALAGMLRRLSDYPLVLLSAVPADQPEMRRALQRLGVRVLPPHARAPVGDFQRLQAWALTEYERVIWIDSDSVVYRSLDWLFDRPGMWAMRQRADCRSGAAKPSSALMVLTPSAADYEDMATLANTSGTELADDRSIIVRHFAETRKTPINLLNDIEASPGHCLGAIATPYINTDGSGVPGSWSTPSFVHRSGGWGPADGHYSNICFSYDLTRQKYYVGASILNACHFNPLASYWRGLFCEVVASAGIRGVQDIDNFCDDSCYFFGRGSGCGGLINATLTYPEYVARTKGMPELEIGA